MKEREVKRLRFGPYQPALIKLGQVLLDEVRDCEVVVCGYTDARIPWPIGKPRCGRARSLIVHSELLRAVRVEANIAVRHWWGVTPQTVTKWRKALGVGTMTAGTTAVRSEKGSEADILAGLAKGRLKIHDPERNEKIAAARRGKPRPAHVIEAMRMGRTGKPQSEQTRAKISEALRRRTSPPKQGVPWTKEQDSLLGTLPAAEVARQTGRPVSSVYSRMRKLRLRKDEGNGESSRETMATFSRDECK